MTSTPSPSSPATESARDRLEAEALAELIEMARNNAITGTLMDDPLLSALTELEERRRPPVSSPTGEGEKNMGVAAGAAAIPPAAEASAELRTLKSIKTGIDIVLNAMLCDMKEGFDDSVVGANEAWDAVRDYLAKQIERASLASPPTGAWRDIASAPKDGTPILAWVSGFQLFTTIPNAVGLAQWVEYKGEGRWAIDPETFCSDDAWQDYWHSTRYDPTHWMPLPAPPGEAGAEVAAEEQVRSPSSGEPVHSSSIRSEALEEAARAAEGAQLPPGFQWGGDALAQFDFGKKRAAEAIRALKEGK